jgi:hypothetical protein
MTTADVCVNVHDVLSHSSCGFPSVTHNVIDRPTKWKNEKPLVLVVCQTCMCVCGPIHCDVIAYSQSLYVALTDGVISSPVASGSSAAGSDHTRRSSTVHLCSKRLYDRCGSRATAMVPPVSRPSFCRCRGWSRCRCARVCVCSWRRAASRCCSGGKLTDQ